MEVIYDDKMPVKALSKMRSIEKMKAEKSTVLNNESVTTEGKRDRRERGSS